MYFGFRPDAFIFNTCEKPDRQEHEHWLLKNTFPIKLCNVPVPALPVT